MMLFRKYKPGKEYWVNIEKIHITPEFAAHEVGHIKMVRKLKFYEKTGEFESKIVLNRQFELIDGYSTYCIAKMFETGKVPVWFED